MADVRRSTTRGVLVWVAIIVGVLSLAWVMWLCWIAASMVYGKPGTAVRYTERFLELAAAHQTPEENPGDGARAWDDFIAVLDEATAIEDEVWAAWEAENPGWDRDPSMKHFYMHYDAIGAFERRLAEQRAEIDHLSLDDPDAAARRWVDEGLGLALHVLDRWDGVRLGERLDATLQRQVYLRPDGGERLFELAMPDFGPMRGLVRTIDGRAARASLAGDGTAYVREIDRMYGIADIAERTPTVIGKLTATAMRISAAVRIRSDLIEGRLDAETCLRLLVVVEQWAARRLDWSITLESERLMGYALIQASHTDSGGGDGRVLLHLTSGFGMTGTSSPQPPNWGNVLGVFMPTKRQSMAKLDEIYGRWENVIHLPYAERVMALSPIEAAVERLGPRYTVVGMIVPSVSLWLESRDMLDVHEGAVRLMLAIEVYRSRHDRPPGSLEALVFEALDEPPRDPFVADGEFGYRVDPESQLGYVLYSVGRDGVDNGGKPAAGKDWHWAIRDDASTGDAVFSEREPLPELDDLSGFDDE